MYSMHCDASTQWKRNVAQAEAHLTPFAMRMPPLHNPLPPLYTFLPQLVPPVQFLAPPLSATFLISAWAKTNENLCVYRPSWVWEEQRRRLRDLAEGSDNMGNKLQLIISEGGGGEREIPDKPY